MKTVRSFTVPSSITVNGKKIKVTKIAARAFEGMTKLKSVVIGDNVTEIGEGAFNKCKNLGSATIGKNVKTIGAKAFFQCKKLKAFIFLGGKLKKVGADAFGNGAANPTVKCPKGKSKAYEKLLKKGGMKKATFTE